MSESEQPGAAAPAAEVPEGGGWQPLPGRALPLFVASGAISAAVPVVITLAIAAFFLLRDDGRTLLGAIAIAGVAVIAAGAWVGMRRFRYTRWLLDSDGFALRRGRMWRAETRVPASRVQHLDIRRGPLERMFGLATLLIHTAGTRQHAVLLSGLDADDAERLRDHLARRVEQDDDES